MENATGLACLAGPVFWMCLLPFAILLGWLTFRSIVRWKARQYLIGDRPATLGTTLYSTLFNPIRRGMGIRPLRVIPRLVEEDRGVAAMLDRSDHLLRQVRASLRHSPMSAERRTALERQAREVPNNLVKALWTLARLRRVRDSIDPLFDRDGRNRREVDDMRRELLAEMTRSLEVLSNIPVSLMKVERARGEGGVDRTLLELDETNKRLLDLSASYAEVKTASA